MQSFWHFPPLFVLLSHCVFLSASRKHTRYRYSPPLFLERIVLGGHFAHSHAHCQGASLAGGSFGLSGVFAITRASMLNNTGAKNHFFTDTSRFGSFCWRAFTRATLYFPYPRKKVKQRLSEKGKVVNAHFKLPLKTSTPQSGGA